MTLISPKRQQIYYKLYRFPIGKLHLNREELCVNIMLDAFNDRLLKHRIGILCGPGPECCRKLHIYNVQIVSKNYSRYMFIRYLFLLCF